MPTPAYLSAEGRSQGNITENAFTEASVGNIWQEGHENEVLINGFKHNVIIPRDPQSGQPSGQRVHQPLTVSKIFDKSSPLWKNALCTGENLTKVEIKWYRTSAAGTQEHYYTITLDDAIVVDIQDSMPHCQDPANASYTHLEDISFSYRRITWTHEASGTSASDDWRAPKV